ncbi:hypothetical protein Q5752_002369 [Cryptotrichosporon argae]
MGGKSQSKGKGKVVSRDSEVEAAPVADVPAVDGWAETKEERKARRRAEKEAKKASIADGGDGAASSVDPPAAANSSSVGEKDKKRKREVEGAAVAETAVASVSKEKKDKKEKRAKREKKDKKGKQREEGEGSSGAAEGEDGLGAADEVEASAADDGSKPKKSKKAKKDKTVKEDKKAAAAAAALEEAAPEAAPSTEEGGLSEQAQKGVEYARAFAGRAAGGWKFNKARQNWLMRNLWTDEIPDEHVGLVVDYLKTMQGASKAALVAVAQKYAAGEKLDPAVGDEAPETAEAIAEAAPADGETAADKDDKAGVDEARLAEMRKARAQGLLRAMDA